MEKEKIARYDGRSVYFFYKLREEEIPNRIGRGVVYNGVCYAASFIMKGNSSLPRFEMQALHPSFIAEIHPLLAEQKTLLEIALEAEMFKGEFSQVRVPIEVVMKEATIKKKTAFKKEGEDVEFDRFNQLYLPNLFLKD